MHGTKGLLTREAGRGHATPHMPVETGKMLVVTKNRTKCVGGVAEAAVQVFKLLELSSSLASSI